MATQLAASSLGVPRNTYIYSLAALGNTRACIASDDSLRLFDPATLQLTNTAPACNEGVSCLQACQDAPSYLTAGRDGRIASWDTRLQRAPLELRTPNAPGLSALACQSYYIAGGTENVKDGPGEVSVLVWDTRNASALLRRYSESHTDTITQLAFHPSRANVLLSGSTDGLVSLFDVTAGEEDDALTQVLNPRSAVHCAGFLSANEAYVVSSDEEVSVYGLGTPAEAEEETPLPVTEFGDVREKLQCRYVIDVLPNLLAPAIAVGDNDAQKLSLVPLQPSWSFGEPVVDLPGAHGEDVVRDVLVDEASRRALTCGEDGIVKVWSLGDAGASADAIHQAMAVDSRATEKSKHGKRKDKDKKGAARFSPY